MFHKSNLNFCARWVNLLLCLILGWFMPLVGRSQTAQGQELIHVYLPMLTRYVEFVESQGELDPGFNSGGLVMTDLTDFDEGLSLAIQRDGKLLVGGEVGIDADYDIDMAVVRYNLDGSLDTSFGVFGWARTDLDEWNDSASDITLQPDGKILQSGSSRDDFALVRYNRDGSLDDTFGNEGWVRTDFLGFGDESKAVAVQPDGRILVAGYATKKTVDNTYDYDFALVRYLADGSLDTSFGEDGKVTTDLTGDQDRAQALVIQPDGKIILVGPAKHSPFLHDFAVVRYNTDGSLDASFGVGGHVFTDFQGGHDFAYAVVLQSDGRIFVAGAATIDNQEDFALARYTSSGLPDTTFSSDGRVTMSFGAGDDDAYDAVLQPNGKIIVAGYAYNGSNDDFALVRYLANGSLDTGFGSGGSLVTDFVGGTDYGLAVALQLDGKIVVAGNASNGDDMDFALARYK